MAGLSASQRTYLTMVNQVLVMHPKWSYLDPAWIMTIMKIESGYQPYVVNGTGRQDGLMQVIPATAVSMASLYGIPAGPQTDPMTSILSGTAYIDDSARGIINARHATSLPLWDVARAYNGGWHNLVPGAMPSAAWVAAVARYLLKFQAALPIVEAQMEAAAMLTSRASFAPRRMRAVMPLGVSP